jgi:hypothetical protein
MLSGEHRAEDEDVFTFLTTTRLISQANPQPQADEVFWPWQVIPGLSSAV